jgi:hypothetical protein
MSSEGGVKVKRTLRLLKSARRHEDVWKSGCIVYAFVGFRHQMQVSGRVHAPATSTSSVKEPSVPLDCLDVLGRRKLSVLGGNKSQFSRPPLRSPSLFQAHFDS